jgi:tripartite ATP-independent transporter DctP family solute receptor
MKGELPMKKWFIVTFLLLGLAGLAGCQSLAAQSSNNRITLKLAHNQNIDHPIHKSLMYFAEKAEEKSNGKIKVDIFPSGQLGTERELIELTQTGAIDFAKVNASALENFKKEYSIFSLPYLFKNEEHYYKTMDSDVMKKIYESTESIGFIGLTNYDSGIRNIYTTNGPITKPEDLNGLKLRVQPSKTSIRMIELMGGSPTPMDYGEVYTGLQQGVLDGTENNETALTAGKHGEVAKYYSYTKHTIIPDILLVSLNTWDSLSSETKKQLTEAAEESTEYHRKIWAEEIKRAHEDAKKMGVQFTEADTEAFRQAVMPLHQEFSEDRSLHYKEIQLIGDDK